MVNEPDYQVSLQEKKTKNANPKKEGKMKSLPAILIGFLAYFAVGVSKPAEDK